MIMKNALIFMLETGVVPHSQALFMAIRGENVSRCQLLVQYGGNPFLHEPDDTVRHGDDDEDSAATAASPFLAAARLQDIMIFAHFLDLWYER
jgi:hypothetical protein